MAHALYLYNGDCRNIHGHSYKLYVTVCSQNDKCNYIKAPGILIDFKELKRIVKDVITDHLDHMLILSKAYVKENNVPSHENLFTFDEEPSAENLLIYISKSISKRLPAGIDLIKLKLCETQDSYAEWVNGSI